VEVVVVGTIATLLITVEMEVLEVELVCMLLITM
jgi:hypothetical protein